MKLSKHLYRNSRLGFTLLFWGIGSIEDGRAMSRTDIRSHIGAVFWL